MKDDSKLDKLNLEDLEYTVLVESSANILFVDDEKVMCTIFKAYFHKSRHQIEITDNAEDALELLKKGEFDLLVTDKNLPGMSGIELMQKAKEINPALECIVATGFASLESAVEALRLGAFDYMIKPFDMDLLKEKIEKAVEKQYLARETAVLAQQLREAHAQVAQARSQQKPVASAADSKVADVSKLTEELHEARRILSTVGPAVEKAIMQLVLMCESPTVKREHLLKIRGILEKVWLDATYPASAGKPKDE